MATTDRFDIPLQADGDDADLPAALNPALERISEVGAGYDRGLPADLPPGYKGQIYQATTTGELWVHDGSGWDEYHPAVLRVDALNTTEIPTASRYVGMRVSIPIPGTEATTNGLRWTAEWDGTRWMGFTGPPWVSTTVSSGITGSTAYVQAGTTITVPYSGLWDLSVEARLFVNGHTPATNNVAAYCSMTTSDLDGFIVSTNNWVGVGSGHRQRRLSLEAGTTMHPRMRLGVTGFTLQAFEPTLTAMPVAVLG